MTEDFERCPFCACVSPKIRVENGVKCVECGECGARGPSLDMGTEPTDTEAQLEWNNRLG